MRTKVLSAAGNFSLLLLAFLLTPLPTVSGRIGAALGIFIVFELIAAWEKRRPAAHSARHIPLICCLTFVGVAVPMVLVFYPGGMIADSHYLFSMAVIDELHDGRSRFLALIYQLMLLLHKSTLPVLVLHVALYASAVSLLVFRLLKNNRPAHGALAFCLALLPTVSGLAGVLCENSWISLCYLLGVVYLYVLIGCNRFSGFRPALVLLLFMLGFLTRSYDVLYGLPLFFILFFLWLKKRGGNHAMTLSLALCFLMPVVQLGTNRAIDEIMGVIHVQKHRILVNYYRSLPVPFDDDIQLPPEVKQNIIQKLNRTNQGWKTAADLADYSILAEEKKIAEGEIFQELMEYIKRKPYMFLKGYLSRAVHMLVIPANMNRITSTRFLSGYKMNLFNFPEHYSFLEDKYVQFADRHLRYAYIYQPIAIFVLSFTTLLLAFARLKQLHPESMVLAAWACSGFIEVLCNLLLTYHGEFRLYHWAVASSMFILVLIHADTGKIR